MTTTTRIAGLVVGLLLLWPGGGCDPGGGPCRKDTDCKGDRVCDAPRGECVAPQEEGKSSGADSGATVALDGAAPFDGAGGSWSCWLDGTSTAYDCSWDWLCDSGDRTLDCVWSSSVHKYKCSCNNVKEGTVEGTFYSDDICSLAAHNAAYRANKGCGWKLPEH